MVKSVVWSKHPTEFVNSLHPQQLGWRWLLAGTLFLSGFIGMMAGAELSERPEIVNAGPLTKAYYTLGLFVVGGLDLGTPDGGPLAARILLWIAYFGCPLLTASAVLEAVLRVIRPDRWQLRNVQNHVIVFGSGRLTISYLRLLKSVDPRAKVVVVDESFDPVTEQELRQKFRARTIVGDLTHDYLLELLRLKRARRVLLLGDNDFQAFEAASRILTLAPRLAGRVVIHCDNLRFMRSLADTDLADKCEVFNTYNLAARGFVQTSLSHHFRATVQKDTVVIAGFGRFGQSVLEELHTFARNEIDQIAVVDVDADRRVLVVAEQERIEGGFESEVYQGDISHPEVWGRLTQDIDLKRDQPTVILGTGQEQENLRTALWLKQGYPNAIVFARTNDISQFALAVGAEHGIKAISITQLVEEHMPARWLS